MGKKKHSARGEDDEKSPTLYLIVDRSKKKAVQVDDYEYSVGLSKYDESNGDKDAEPVRNFTGIGEMFGAGSPFAHVENAAAAATGISFVDAKEERQEELVTEPQQLKKKDIKGKAEGKEVPKYVREMQEALARWREVKGIKKKEEEEKPRRQGMLEAQSERKRKEKEKEKLLRKKLLTAKRKSEALKRDAFKKQLLAAAEGLHVSDDSGASLKRLIYVNEKTVAHQKGNNTFLEVEDEVKPKENHACVGEVSSRDLEKVEEEECDLKSWIYVDLNIKDDLNDEEEEVQPVVTKELKNHVVSKARDSDLETGKPAANVTVISWLMTLVRDWHMRKQS